ncbi:MAG: YbaN family protein [Ruminiclostridium sp.]|nr:YbaN family protein [Ruminiclostridium sp.]
MQIKRLLYLVTGILAGVLGTIGIFLPILPTVPLYLLAAFCFARSSEKLHTWFTGTRLYRENLESYAQGQGMTRRTKVRIMATTTVVMTAGFVMMDQLLAARVLLACVWLFHVLYFGFRVKTIPEPHA